MRTRVTTVLLSLLALASASACGNRYDPVLNAHRVEGFERNLIEVAARDSGCSPVQVAHVRIAETLWVANTCAGPPEYYLDCRNRGRRWANCRWDRIATVSEAASQVMACPPAAIAQEIGVAPTTRSAQGCGMRVTMTLRCNEFACGWVADGPAQGTHTRGYPPAPTVVVVPAP